HVPIWISFNLKDQAISGLPEPEPFTPEALRRLDDQLLDALGERLIKPKDVEKLRWPPLEQSRGKFLLILDEGGAKRDWYYDGWRERPMFTNAPEGHPAAAVMIINNPKKDFVRIQRLVKAGYMVRTRADANTVQARNNDTSQREQAFASGAQAISTDYYLPAQHFGNDYQVQIPGGVRCNPLLTAPHCQLVE
ncbi:MAG: Ca2+-dependent phosphoinositide-specific phospholipase C, partial [Pseudomonadota bacterium]|nr:Ca2+-dependent phosphoinositide-specific phospholipase C [Pseudomonadota bacterium]